MDKYIDSYADGFVKNCESFGVDPESLVKWSQGRQLTGGRSVHGAIPYTMIGGKHFPRELPRKTREQRRSRLPTGPGFIAGQTVKNLLGLGPKKKEEIAGG